MAKWRLAVASVDYEGDLSKTTTLALAAFTTGLGLGAFCWFHVLFLWTAYGHAGI